MAKKINRRPPAAPPAPENDLDVLHPDRDVLLGARKVTVREYRHIEWLRLLPQAEPLVAAIAGALEAGRDPTYEEALACLVQHIDALAPLIAQAADMDADAHAALDPEHGELLLMTWWGVNGRFFVNRALNRVAVRRQEARNRAAVVGAESAGAKSTSP